MMNLFHFVMFLGKFIKRNVNDVNLTFCQLLFCQSQTLHTAHISKIIRKQSCTRFDLI